MKKLRLRASIVIVRDGKILGFHAEDPFSHQKYFFLPGGKIESDEIPEAAVLRETIEETGYTAEIDSRSQALFERYDFTWNGEINDCQTWFFKGNLKPADQPLREVRDASYHQGVDWIPVSEVERVFGYHSTILRAVKILAKEN